MPDLDNARVGTPLADSQWKGRVVVVSPHLDDAVLSLGASMRAASRRGVEVDVLTVLSGNPDSTSPSDRHNAKAGFATAGEASRARRIEDEEACRAVGARALWLPFSDDANEPTDRDDAITAALADRLREYDAVLLPGFPLKHRDHQRIIRLALAALPPDSVVGLYVEQPYASWRAFSRKTLRTGRTTDGSALADAGLTLTSVAEWQRAACAPSDWAMKIRAAGAYRSQMPVLRKAPRARILVHELMRRGERVCWYRVR